jgi:hypothetical protein
MSRFIPHGKNCTDRRCGGCDDADSVVDLLGKTSAVNHPAHYGGGDNPYEAIKVIEAWQLDFCLGNAVKYISRAGKKTASPREDLEKAIWYLQRRLKQVTDAESPPKHLK